MTQVTQVQEAKREYARKYRAANRQKLADYQKEWRKKHPDKSKEYQRRYWEKRAAKAEAGGGTV